MYHTLSYQAIEHKCMTSTLHLHTSASERGYISTKTEPTAYPYEGKYGKGWKVVYNNTWRLPNGHLSNRFHRIEYYVY